MAQNVAHFHSELGAQHGEEPALGFLVGGE